MAHIGVVGAGVMGAGVAQDMAQYGHEVTLVDHAEDVLKRAQVEVEQYGRMRRLLGKVSGDPANLGDRVRYTTDLLDLANVDFLIENITENWELKRDLYPRLDAACPAGCIFAANTSAISITRIASVTERPERVIGVHFMNPVPLKSTVEVIRGWHTAQATLDDTMRLLASVGKKGIVVGDSPGFVSNRVLMPTINEAICLVADGVAQPTEVDEVFRSCFGHPMGPLETADLIGLDTILYSIEVLRESFGDSKYAPCPLLKKMVDAGLKGRKSGRGFYTYG
jgi:3-hydroxybutyryl-CoA dehydrogenase